MNLINGYKEIEKIIGYEFENPEFIKTALSHSSYINEVKIKNIECYERMEFLGDAVLELTVSEYLYKEMKEMPEGEMTKLRASLVCEPTLAYCARIGFDLPKYLLLGKGEENTGGRNRDSIVSDVFEAIIGALYLDGGFDASKPFIEEYVLKDMYNKIEFTDSKTRLQEYVQNIGLDLNYELVKEDGPAHDKTYFMDVYVDGKLLGQGSGKTKKSAEQHAAFEALKVIKSK